MSTGENRRPQVSSITWERGFRRISLAMWLLGIAPAGLLGAGFAYDELVPQLHSLPAYRERVPLWSPRQLVHSEDRPRVTLKDLECVGKETAECIDVRKESEAWDTKLLPLYRTAFYWKAWGVTLGALVMAATGWSAVVWGGFFGLRWIIRGFL